MERLLPGVQHYAWGSTTALPDILGIEPDGNPWAELWIGDHPRLPSTVASTGAPLDVGLPFLLKVLAAAEPLSIQTHPSLERAQSGFDRENRLGIALDAPNRIYRDANHKPELICALTPFDALVGFRDPNSIVDELGPISALAPIVDRLGHADPAIALRSTTQWILGLAPAEAAPLVSAAADANDLAALLHHHHPGDPGVLVGMLLHRILLEPGEAVFLGAGNLHAYLSGVAVELMANSDNVVRGGLTPKHIDVDELLAVASFEPFEPAIQHAVGPVHEYISHEAGFGLTRIEISSGQGSGSVGFSTSGPEILLVTSGAVEVCTDRTDPIVLEPGGAGFVTAGCDVGLAGEGVAWRATAGR